MNQSIILVHFCIDVVSRNGDVVNDFLASRFGLGETFWTDQLVLDFNLILHFTALTLKRTNSIHTYIRRVPI